MDRFIDNPKIRFLLLGGITAFPSAFKILNLAIISVLSSADTVDRYAQLIFIVLLANSLSGIPLSALLVKKGNQPNWRLIKVFSTIAGILSTLICASFVSKNYSLSFQEIGVLCLTTVCLNQFSIIRQLLLNQSNVIFLSVACVGSCLISISFLALFSEHDGALILLYSHTALLIPLLFSKIHTNIEFQCESTKDSNLRATSVGFFNYLIINCLSTSLSFVLPIYITYRLGSDNAAEIAAIFFAASLAYLVPRTLSNKYIPILRNSNKPSEVLTRFILYNNICNILLILISVLVLFGIGSDLKAISLLLLTGLVAGQFTLPHSNFFMVKGKSSTILRINIISFAFLVFSFGILQLLELGRVNEVQLMLFFYVIFQIIRYILSLMYCAKMECF